MSNLLKVDHLEKQFGNHKVIADLSFQVKEHSILGLVGKNGAGKTTTMKMILGLLKPDSGSISVCGETVRYGQSKTNRYIGYLPDVPEYYGFMNARQYLKFCGEITGMSSAGIKERTEELLELVGLKECKNKISGYSRGMKQRLGIAQALIHEPKLLICDEPTSALDPIGRKDILDILVKIKEQTTVIFSTHILSDVERVCDEIVILEAGKAALCGKLQEIKKNCNCDVLSVDFSDEKGKKEFLKVFEESRTTEKIQMTDLHIEIHTGKLEETEQKVLEILHNHRIIPIRLEQEEPSLERLFLEVVE